MGEVIFQGVAHIDRLFKEIKFKKGILFGIAQVVITIILLGKVLFGSGYFDLFYLIVGLISFVLAAISLSLWIKTPLCKMDESCNNIMRVKGSSIRNLKCLSREQRHDYMNILQIIYGYLQLKKNDKAIEQIKKITNMATSVSKIYNLSILSVSLLLEKKIKEADNRGVELICNAMNYIENEFRSIRNEEQIILKLTEIIDYLIGKVYRDSNQSKLFINIFEYYDKLEVVIKCDVDITIESDIQNMHKSTLIDNGEIKIIFEYCEVKNILPENTIYYTLLNKA